jgi:hypothetical protein
MVERIKPNKYISYACNMWNRGPRLDDNPVFSDCYRCRITRITNLIFFHFASAVFASTMPHTSLATRKRQTWYMPWIGCCCVAFLLSSHGGIVQTMYCSEYLALDIIICNQHLPTMIAVAVAFASKRQTPGPCVRS